METITLNKKELAGVFATVIENFNFTPEREAIRVYDDCVVRTVFDDGMLDLERVSHDKYIEEFMQEFKRSES